MIDWLECGGGMWRLTNIYVTGVFSGILANLIFIEISLVFDMMNYFHIKMNDT